MSWNTCMYLPERRSLIRIVALLVLSPFAVSGALAQPEAPRNDAGATKAAEATGAPEVYETLSVTNTTDQGDIREIANDLRNMLPHARIYQMAAQGAISVSGTAQEVQLARKMVAELDRPRRSYRLTYTLYELENGKRVSSRSFTLNVAQGQRAYLRQGTRIPIVTGTASAAEKSSQVQYIDIGLNLEASIEGAAGSLRLHTKLEQTSLGDEASGMGSQDPVIRQSVFEEASVLTPGKAILLGSFAGAGGTKTEEVEVVSEVVL